MADVGIVDAAKALNVHPATVRKWIREGCPCVTLGTVGRGRGARVDLSVMRRWRLRGLAPEAVQRADADVLALIARSLSDALKRDGAHDRVDICEARAAGLLAMVYERIWMNMTMQPRYQLVVPPEIERLGSIYVQWRKSFHGR